jgi:hypothetical protein
VPRGRNADDRLARLARRLDGLADRSSRLPERREYTDEEIVEISLILLCYVCEGSTEKFAEFLVKNSGTPLAKAQEIAAGLGRILEHRGASAMDPAHPL